MLRVRAKFAPKLCDYPGPYHEVRWDLSGCNLRCLFCWSPASRPTETGDPSTSVDTQTIAMRTSLALHDPARTFVRFTGGEPTLQWRGVVDALAAIRMNGPTRRPPILFQTNGIEIGNDNTDLSELAEDPNQLYLFEVSFKGTNPSEFALLTGRDFELYHSQLAGYRRLLDFANTTQNVAIVAVLGVYHSSPVRGESKYAFVNPKSGALLFDDPRAWHPKFAEAWNLAPFKWVERLRMSPKGLWENVLARCGPLAAGVLAHFPYGVVTNAHRVFSAKPQSGDYARQIVSGRFWPESIRRRLPDWKRTPLARREEAESIQTAERPSPIPGAVRVGSLVTLSDGSTYTVGEDVSLGSPIGTALLGRFAGDVVTVKTPGGMRDFRIEKVE